MAMYLRITLLLLLGLFSLNYGDVSDRQAGRPRSQNVNDREDEIRTNVIDLDDTVVMNLSPSEPQQLMEGDDITFNCKIRSRPPDSQLQWYYIIRQEDGSISNFTILANDVATIDKNRYTVSTIPPNIYTLEINEMREKDSGEYCCFLYVTYSETYRQSTEVTVHRKSPPPAAVSISTSHVNSQSSDLQHNSKLEEIIEQAVEFDIEQELGHRLNITSIKSNVQAQALIHNATDKIKSLLQINGGNINLNSDDLNKQLITSRIRGISNQVKTVVTTLLHQMVDYNITLLRVDGTSNTNNKRFEDRSRQLTNQPQRPGRRTENRITTRSAPTPEQRRDTPPAWRRVYDQYKNGGARDRSANQPQTTTPTIPLTTDRTTPRADRSLYEGNRGDLSEPHTASIEREEERQRGYNRGVTGDTHTAQGTRCEYHLIVNEFDPNQCPNLRDDGYGAAKYYEHNNRGPASSGTGGENQPISNTRLERLENKILDEMVNNKMVNETVKMHDDMLSQTEETLKNQGETIANLREQVEQLNKELRRSNEDKKNMDEKMTDVMLNIMEVNKRLDRAMSSDKSNTQTSDKRIQVESSSQVIQCDQHPNVTHYKDCAEVEADGNTFSGIYYIKLIYSACPIPVWCDLDTYPGGWLNIQRRVNGNVNFNRDMNEYRHGFGHVDGDHWLGNDNLFLLTNQDSYMLRVDLWDFYDSRVFAEYLVFKVGSYTEQYQLNVMNYTGTAGDGLKTHNGVKFSTRDRDGDAWEDYHCANEWEGGWWFTNCWSSFLNGIYYDNANPPYQGIAWRDWKEEQLKKVEMKVRPTIMRLPSDKSADEEIQSDQPRQIRLTNVGKRNEA